jgi:hypothetical protein
MPDQAGNATLDLEGLEVIAVAAFGDLIALRRPAACLRRPKPPVSLTCLFL